MNCGTDSSRSVSEQVMPCGCVLIAYLGLATIWDGNARTLSFEIDDWSNQSWGFHNIDRRRIRCEVAVGNDGSRMNSREHAVFHHYFIPSGSAKVRAIYTASDHAAFWIDDSTRTARGGPCSCTWQPFRTFPDDRKCSRTAQARLDRAQEAGSRKVAGYEAVQYRGVSDGGEEIELSLAPTLGCEVMELVRTWPGTLGIPGARWRYRITSYRSAQPDPKLFQVPPGYSVRHEPE